VQALGIYTQVFGPEHPDTMRTARYLTEVRDEMEAEDAMIRRADTYEEVTAAGALKEGGGAEAESLRSV
jgi:hypothetical protein